MGLSKKDLQEIRSVFSDEIQKLKPLARYRAKDLVKLTKKRLYAYPLLKINIERYKADIEDIKKEDMGKSKSIVMFSPSSKGGERPTLEELREAKIMIVERKIARDENEIKEIDTALSTILDDEYYPIIEMSFFQKMSEEDICNTLHCASTTLWRNKGRLIDIMNVSLYGADSNEI